MCICSKKLFENQKHINNKKIWIYFELRLFFPLAISCFFFSLSKSVYTYSWVNKQIIALTDVKGLILREYAY